MHRWWLLAVRPSSWVALGILSIPLGSSGTSTTSSGTPADLVLLVAVVLAAISIVGEPGAARLLRTVPGVLLVLLGLASCAAALVAPRFPEGLVGGVRFLQLFCLVPVAVLVSLRARRDAYAIVGALVGLAVVQGALGIWQFATGTGAGIGGESIRAVGTFGAYNIGALAELTGLALVVCLAGAVVLRGRVRWWALGLALGLALPLAFSLTRGAWLAAGIAVVAVLSRGVLWRLALTVVAGALLLGMALPVMAASGGELATRVTSIVSADSTPDQSVTDRLSLWGAAIGMAVDHPWAGTGPRGFVEHRDAYADLSLLGSSDISLSGDFERVALESPHNFYLLVASEQGLLVAGLYVITFLVFAGRGAVRGARDRTDLSTAVAVAGTGVLVYQLMAWVSADLGGPGSVFAALVVGLAAWSAADVDLLDDTADRRPPGADDHPAEPADLPRTAVAV